MLSCHSAALPHTAPILRYTTVVRFVTATLPAATIPFGFDTLLPRVCACARAQRSCRCVAPLRLRIRATAFAVYTPRPPFPYLRFASFGHATAPATYAYAHAAVYGSNTRFARGTARLRTPPFVRAGSYPHRFVILLFTRACCARCTRHTHARCARFHTVGFAHLMAIMVCHAARAHCHFTRFRFSSYGSVVIHVHRTHYAHTTTPMDAVHRYLVLCHRAHMVVFDGRLRTPAVRTMPRPAYAPHTGCRTVSDNYSYDYTAHCTRTPRICTTPYPHTFCLARISVCRVPRTLFCHMTGSDTTPLRTLLRVCATYLRTPLPRGLPPAYDAAAVTNRILPQHAVCSTAVCTGRPAARFTPHAHTPLHALRCLVTRRGTLPRFVGWFWIGLLFTAHFRGRSTLFGSLRRCATR